MTDYSATAHHEAGHAVVTIMRHHDVRFVTIEPTEEHAGCTGMRTRHRLDDGFISYAGPWAQGRAEWQGPAPDDLDTEADEMILFADYVVVAFLNGGHADLQDMEEWFSDPIQQAIAQALPNELGNYRSLTETNWHRELDVLTTEVGYEVGW